MSLPPAKIIGCDFSGEVTALGTEVPPKSFAIGDRVAGVVHGCKHSHTGAFAETLVADANMCFKLPETANKKSDLEAACTLGVGWISAAQALKQRLYEDDKTTIDNEDTVGLYLLALFEQVTDLVAALDLLGRHQHRHACHPASTH